MIGHQNHEIKIDKYKNEQTKFIKIVGDLALCFKQSNEQRKGRQKVRNNMFPDMTEKLL